MELLGLIAVAAQELAQHPEAYWRYVKRTILDLI